MMDCIMIHLFTLYVVVCGTFYVNRKDVEKTGSFVVAVFLIAWFFAPIHLAVTFSKFVNLAVISFNFSSSANEVREELGRVLNGK